MRYFKTVQQFIHNRYYIDINTRIYNSAFRSVTRTQTQTHPELLTLGRQINGYQKKMSPYESPVYDEVFSMYLTVNICRELLLSNAENTG